VRLNFVDHGENFANGENGMDKLTDKVKQIYDTYAIENTHFERIALVGCDTTNIKQGLARNFAKTIYVWYFVSRPCKCSSKSLAIFSKIFVFRIPGSDALAF
jgi:hypothetical protein